MVYVVKQKGESEDKLIARFKKMVMDSNVLQEARDRQRHKTASEKRKDQKKKRAQSIKLENKRNR